MNPESVIAFWFKELKPEQWFNKPSKELDTRIRTKFLKTYEAVVRGETAHWRNSARGRLAEIIVLDQFSRNMFRGTPDMYRYDALALMLAQESVALGVDKKLNKTERGFLYLPFMHSESKKIQKDSLRLFSTLGSEENLKYAKEHKKIIDTFGRYPHRNAILGRTSSPAEKKFMLTHKGF